MAFLAMGDNEYALEWLEKAYTEGRGWMVWLKVVQSWTRSVPIRGFKVC